MTRYDVQLLILVGLLEEAGPHRSAIAWLEPGEVLVGQHAAVRRLPRAYVNTAERVDVVGAGRSDPRVHVAIVTSPPGR